MKLHTLLLGAFLMLAISKTENAQTKKVKALPAKTAVNKSLPADKKPAPLFNLTSLDGKKFELTALRGKIVVLNFWFTGCIPCVAEMPELNKLVEKFKNDDVVFIAPTLDAKSVLPAFLVKHPFEYSVVPSAGNLIVNTYRDGTGTVAFPVNIIIDQEGKIDTRLTNSLVKSNGNTKELEKFENAIKRLVQKAAK